MRRANVLELVPVAKSISTVFATEFLLSLTSCLAFVLGLGPSRTRRTITALSSTLMRLLLARQGCRVMLIFLVLGGR